MRDMGYEMDDVCKREVREKGMNCYYGFNGMYYTCTCI